MEQSNDGYSDTVDDKIILLRCYRSVHRTHQIQITCLSKVHWETTRDSASKIVIKAESLCQDESIHANIIFFSTQRFLLENIEDAGFRCIVALIHSILYWYFAIWW